MIKCATCRKEFNNPTFNKGASPDGDIQPLYFFKKDFSSKGGKNNLTYYEEDLAFCSSLCCTTYKVNNEKSSKQ